MADDLIVKKSGLNMSVLGNSLLWENLCHGPAVWQRTKEEDKSYGT